ncbi:hypothetical protein QUF49_03970 [Fictibacillus sp. b24]|uniref:hypothetical protein n=1 Tax=Fictibacillus sp. b24 TaxID=3055863 RepID=UPI0025A25E36|nr:hypothetical protein [Fictibacillus sp. b24]MDM5315138.1 hypothetical protein [Fictibacillus sp. b24]
MRDSCGTGGQVRHLRVKRANVAHRLPRGKRASGTEINVFQKVFKLISTSSKNNNASPKKKSAENNFLYG